MMILNLIIGAGALQGFFLSFTLFKMRVKHKSYAKLSIILFILAISLLGRYSYNAEVNNEIPHLFLLADLTYFLVGPLFYFFIKEVLNSNFIDFGKIWKHFIPYFLHLVSTSIQWAIHPDKYRVLVQDHFDPLYDLWYVTEVMSLVHLGIYLSVAVYFVVKKAASDGGINSYNHPKYKLLNVMLGVMIVGVCLWSIKHLTKLFGLAPLHPILGYEAAWILITILVFALAYLAITSPLHLASANDNPEVKKQENGHKYLSSSLKKVDMDLIVDRLLPFISRPEIFSNHNLRLRDVSEHLEVSSNHISQSINEVLNKNFFDLINEKRVAAIKSNLANPDYSNYTFAAIAMEFGFKSPSSFYRIFKQHTGKTPKDYIKSSRSYVCEC